MPRKETTMSEKIKLANGQEFDLVPMGINSLSDKRRQFKFTSDMSYDDIKAMFLNPDNLASIDHILQSGEITTTYTDCVSLKQVSTEFDVQIGENTMDVYTVTLSIDSVEKQLQNVSGSLETTNSDIDALVEAVSAILIEIIPMIS